MNRDNDAINRLRNNQNRIQTTGNLTNDEQAFVNNPDMVNKYEEIEEGASGIAEGGATTSKKGLIGLGFLGKLKKIKFFIIGGLISILLFGVILIATIFTNEKWKGHFLTDNVKDNTSQNGSTSTSFISPSGTKHVNAVVSSFYKSTLTANESFFSDLKKIADNYNNYSLENGVSLTEGEFDISMIAAAIHYNKFISDANVISGAINGYKTMSNMGVARSRTYTSLPVYEIKSFYELADISLGIDTGIPDPEMRGLAGNLVGSKVISTCVTDKKGYLSNAQISGQTKHGAVTYDVLDSTIIRYETLYYSGAPINGYKDDNTQTVRWYAQQLKKRLDTMRQNGTFSDYYDTSEYDPNMNCGSNYLVHYVQKYMNYETFAKYLLNEYIPENYIECLDCNSTNKRENNIEIAYAIYNNRNEFASYYYNDVIDTINFSNGDSLTTTQTEYQLPEEVKQNFTSPFNLNAKCSISSQFTANRNGYSHYAIDAYANDRTLIAVYDGVVDVVVDGIPNIFNQWNGGACVDSSGKMDNRSNGNYVRIKHELGGKTYYSYYMHMESISVKPGEKVTKGQKIGVEGTTGCSSGYHLHYQLVSGNKRYDPSLLFAQCDGVSILTYEPKSLKEYLYSVYPSYTFTNKNECVVKVYDGEDAYSGPYSTMDLETYVAGVVSHEMSTGSNFEALKAQAIAARNEYVHRTKYCTSGEIVPNSEDFQTHFKIDTTKNRDDIINMLAARETAGMLISYSYGLHFTEYASFPCEGVYICTNPIVYDPVTHIQVDKFVPYYDVSRSKVTCRSASHGDDDKKVEMAANPSKDGSAQAQKAASKCKNGGTPYYCGSTSVPRQFRNQANVKSIVGDCSTISVNILPHEKANNTFRTIPVAPSEIKEGRVDIGHTDNPEEDYSNFTGHNRGMSQVLADVYANKFGWNYEQILHYFYDPEETSKYNLINLVTPLKLLDDQTEYEANYTDCCTGVVTLPVKGHLTIRVPVDFYVAGLIQYNVGLNVNKNLLNAMAISARTWALNNTSWGTKTLDASGQYNYTYTESKEIYDAINATKEQLLVDADGYITPTEYTYVGKDGTVKESKGNKIITYELGYLYNDDTHKVMIPYDDNFANYTISGNVGLVYNVASYLANNWYFVDQYELLKFFYGENFNATSWRNMNTIGAIKDKDGNISGDPSSFNAMAGALNQSLEQYVAANGKGTLQGVLAAAYWLYVHSNETKDINLPYQLGGMWRQLGVNPNWGQQETNPRYERFPKIGLDCVEYIRWAFINGYFTFPNDYATEHKFRGFTYQFMQEYIEKKKLTCGENGESCYVEFDKENDKPIHGVPLAKYVESGLINPGDVLYHKSGTVYAGETEPQKYSHIGIVYKVDLQNRTIVILHCSGGDPGVKYSTINIDTGRYESDGKHSFTSVIRMSEIEKRGYLK